jgi:hypothetical protein
LLAALIVFICVLARWDGFPVGSLDAFAFAVNV